LIDLGRVGIWSIGLRFHPDAGEIAEAAAELEELGFGALFTPGGVGGEDVFPSMGRLLAATRWVPVVSGIVNVWMHSPEETAAAFAGLEREHPGRFQLGLGISHSDLVAGYSHPLAAMNAYLDGLDAVPRERRLIAALGPRMLDLARDRSAGTHPYFVPVEHTRFARERLGPDAVIAVEQAVLLETDPAVARTRAREHMAGYLARPNYTDNLARLGFGEDDRRGGGSDRLVDAIVAWGDEQAVAERVAAHHAAGADHVCVQVVGGVEHGLPREQWRRLAAVLA
jgi:probable F420-dependent oxidoreductase